MINYLIVVLYLPAFKEPAMDKGLKQWILQQHEKMVPENKPGFLRALKFHPDQVLQYISNKLHDWGMWATVQTCDIVAVNFETDPKEILEALREHFAADLAKITA